mmetsp:Transcript_83145/g.182669  ORF Transcript_83145/g.182669 Transcript_83145/m.182669 type:complete len:104 (+) Transcript_83145:31-342(+)
MCSHCGTIPPLEGWTTPAYFLQQRARERARASESKKMYRRRAKMFLAPLQGRAGQGRAVGGFAQRMSSAFVAVPLQPPMQHPDRAGAAPWVEAGALDDDARGT